MLVTSLYPYVLQATFNREFPGFNLYLYPSAMSDKGLTIFMNVTAKDQITSGRGIMGNYHTGKCIRRFADIYIYCRYFIDRKW